MSNVIKLPVKAATNKVKENVIAMPNIFLTLLNLYQKRQHEIRKKKIQFLTEQAYEYYYALLETPEVTDIDLPPFVYEQQREKLAHEYAAKAVLRVIADDRVDKCYKGRIRELKNIKKWSV